jgi:hypothetical protein
MKKTFGRREICFPSKGQAEYARKRRTNDEAGVTESYTKIASMYRYGNEKSAFLLLAIRCIAQNVHSASF